jgi:hypothetical protein
MSAAIIEGCEVGVWSRIYYQCQTFESVGVLRDGSLHNPNGYDEALVRQAIREATERLQKRRSEAAKRAALTRERRHQRRVYEIARRIVARESLGPREHCACCGKGLTDAEAIIRGIGSDCWQHVLAAITASQGGTNRNDELNQRAEGIHSPLP